MIEHPEVIERYLGEERSAGRILGPMPSDVVQQMQINRFGVIPKDHNTGKWRLISDLSFPDQASVDDGIDP